VADRDRGAGSAKPAVMRACDPYRDIDAQPDLAPFVESLEARGRMASHARLRRRFLRAVPIRPGDRVLEVGCGTGVVVRDLAALVGPRGRVEGVDVSRGLVAAARRLCRVHPLRRRITLRVADGRRLPGRDDRYDATLALTVLLHVADPAVMVAEMARVTRPGGRVALQDQDFGTLAVTHPDRALTARILTGVATRLYEEPASGRRLPALLRAAGVERVRLVTDVYQDTRLGPYTWDFLERRAERAVAFGLVARPRARRWLETFRTLRAAGAFVLTLNFYGAVGEKSASRRGPGV
jgi:ubiquinone/menaquinone biosynthesis C-methylase UbiE